MGLDSWGQIQTLCQAYGRNNVLAGCCDNNEKDEVMITVFTSNLCQVLAVCPALHVLSTESSRHHHADTIATPNSQKRRLKHRDGNYRPKTKQLLSAGDGLKTDSRTQVLNHWSINKLKIIKSADSLSTESSLCGRKTEVQRNWIMFSRSHIKNAGLNKESQRERQIKFLSLAHSRVKYKSHKV